MFGKTLNLLKTYFKLKGFILICCFFLNPNANLLKAFFSQEPDVALTASERKELALLLPDGRKNLIGCSISGTKETENIGY